MFGEFPKIKVLTHFDPKNPNYQHFDMKQNNTLIL